MSAPFHLRLLQQITDPFGFHDALRDLSLAPGDLPTLTRESRLLGDGH